LANTSASRAGYCCSTQRAHRASGSGATWRDRRARHDARGADAPIALPRDQHLFDGAVLLVEPDRAIVVRVDEERWLRLQPARIADAIELGTTPAICIGGCALKVKRCWSRSKRRWTTTRRASARW